MAKKNMSTTEGGRDASGSQSGLDQQPLEVRHLVLHFMGRKCGDDEFFVDRGQPHLSQVASVDRVQGKHLSPEPHKGCGRGEGARASA